MVLPATPNAAVRMVDGKGGEEMVSGKDFKFSYYKKVGGQLAAAWQGLALHSCGRRRAPEPSLASEGCRAS